MAAVLCACALFVFAAVRCAFGHSATSDEMPHIGAGVRYTVSDTRLNREHPPLVKWLAALALSLPSVPELPPAASESTQWGQWAYGHVVLHRAVGAGEALERLGRARLPVVFHGALALLIAAVMAHRLRGPVAAVAAALISACSPLWLAHSSVVTMDAALSTWALAAAASAHAHLTSERLRWPSLALLFVSVAAGMLVKYSMPVVVLGLGAAVTVAAWAQRSWPVFVRMQLTIACGALVGAAFAWGLPPSLSSYVEGMRSVGANHEPDYPYYAFGEFFEGRGARGDVAYFVRALLVKLEWPLLLLAVVGAAVLAHAALGRAEAERNDDVRSKVDLAFSSLPPLAYLAAMSAFAPALGVRYVLPVVPFAFVLAGVGAARVAQLRVGQAALIVLAALELSAFVQTRSVTPLAWFNGFPCRTGQYPPCLDDSNVDWGQSLPALAAYRDAHYPGVPLRIVENVWHPLPAYLPNAHDVSERERLSPYRALYAFSLHVLVRMSEDCPFPKLPPPPSSTAPSPSSTCGK